jgi:hypothetical protein
MAELEDTGFLKAVVSPMSTVALVAKYAYDFLIFHVHPVFRLSEAWAGGGGPGCSVLTSDRRNPGVTEKLRVWTTGLCPVCFSMKQSLWPRKSLLHFHPLQGNNCVYVF